jgi:hypothetical protein
MRSRHCDHGKSDCAQATIEVIREGVAIYPMKPGNLPYQNLSID